MHMSRRRRAWVAPRPTGEEPAVGFRTRARPPLAEVKARRGRAAECEEMKPTGITRLNREGEHHKKNN